MPQSESIRRRGSLKSIGNQLLRLIGYEIKKIRPPQSALPKRRRQPMGAPIISNIDGIKSIQAPHYLVPNAHKLYDFRTESGFQEIATQVISEKRTLLGFDRLFTLWQAIQNTNQLDYSAAEVGVYRGGSTRFIASVYRHLNRAPRIHAFDTFTGHPDVIASELDGNHTIGLFGDTALEGVQRYLSAFENVQLHPGVFPTSADGVHAETFSCVHIDVDLYQSAVDCLNFFWSRLCEHGVIVVDDYGFVTCRGLKQAVDVFVAQHPDCIGWYVYTGQYVLEKRGGNASA